MSQPVEHEFRVRYSECDQQGIVFNAHYVAYMDDGMTELMRAAFGSYENLTARGIDMVVAEINTVFKGSAKFDELVRLEVAIADLGTTSMTTRHQLTRDAELLVEGRIRHVFVETEGWEKTPIPDWAREALSPFLL